MSLSLPQWPHNHDFSSILPWLTSLLFLSLIINWPLVLRCVICLPDLFVPLLVAGGRGIDAPAHGCLVTGSLSCLCQLSSSLFPSIAILLFPVSPYFSWSSSFIPEPTTAGMWTDSSLVQREAFCISKPIVKTPVLLHPFVSPSPLSVDASGVSSGCMCLPRRRLRLWSLKLGEPSVVIPVLIRRKTKPRCCSATLLSLPGSTDYRQVLYYSPPVFS